MKSACVLQLIFAHKLPHLILQTEFEFFQTMLFQLFLGSQRVLGFERLNLQFVFLVLLRELAVFLTRLHQVRFNFVLCVLFHFRHLSLVESPRQTGPWN